MEEIMNMPGMVKVYADQCAYGLKTKKKGQEGPAKKPTGFMTNSPHLAKALSRRCRGGACAY